MGPKHSQNLGSAKYEKISKNHFEFMYVVGKGGFGKVWKVMSKKHKKLYALKEMAKVRIIDRKSEKSILYERDLLSKLKHPFIVNMNCCFQDYDNLYLVMDLLNGGDLRYHISRQKKFTEEQTKFFVACIILGLEYIHSKKVLHRDIKPENLVLDEKGYLRITDFGVAKIYQKENANETSGTPGYMAPEVMCAQNHSYGVDYFALGVLAFEFMYGIRPYLGKTRKEIKELILSRQVQIRKTDIPDNWTSEAADFINKLLQRKPNHRLGVGGIKELKEHAWFANYPWDELFRKELTSPFIPKNGDNFDKRYCEGADKIGNDTYERYQGYYKTENFTEVFRNYTFVNMSEMREIESASKTPNKNILLHKTSNFSSGNLMSKIKIADHLSQLKKPPTQNIPNVVKALSQMTPDKRPRFKSNSMAGLQLNQYGTKYNTNINNNHNHIPIPKFQTILNVNTPFKLSNNNSKNNDQLPYIDTKLSKSIIRQKLMNSTNNSNNKLTNSSSSTSISKPPPNKLQFSTLNSSLAVSSNFNINSALHRRSGSTNYFQ